MTGRPGLCLAALGPGATNLATGVGCAFLDRSPMIAITCNLNTDQLGRRLQMSIDHHALFRPITKATLPLRTGTIAATLAEALRIALSEPQGPVHLDLPEDVALAETKELVPEIPIGTRVAAPKADSIAKAQDILARAKQPIAVLGADARRMKDPALLPAPYRAARDAVPRHDDGQGPDRRRSSALARLYRARLPPGAAQISARERPDCGARLRHGRSRVRGMDRRCASLACRARAGGYQRQGRGRAIRSPAISMLP